MAKNRNYHRGQTRFVIGLIIVILAGGNFFRDPNAIPKLLNGGSDMIATVTEVVMNTILIAIGVFLMINGSKLKEKPDPPEEDQPS